MNIIEHYLTNNACYMSNRRIKPAGIMIHSTAVKGAMAKNFLSSWNVLKPNGKEVCVHGFIDNTGVYQTLPWDIRGWHCGGSANNSLIGVEVCEPKDYTDKAYFENVKQKVIDLCVYLCKKYNWSASAITTHCEGYQRYGSSYASNHADIYHWWKVYHNYTMKELRADVAERLEEEKMLNDLIEKYGEEAVRKSFVKLIESVNDDGKESEWATKEFDEAKDMNITDGTNPEMFATRQEVAIMVKRAVKDKQ